jgi:hypothetical protein
MYHRVLFNSATFYHQMLSSWVGEQAKPLKLLQQFLSRPLPMKEAPALPRRAQRRVVVAAVT